MDLFDGTEADEVFDEASEIGNVHAGDAAMRAREAHGAQLVLTRDTATRSAGEVLEQAIANQLEVSIAEAQ